MNRAQQYHRDFYPVDMWGCVLYLPFWRYGANPQKIWDQSGQGNHGTITGSVPYPGGYIVGDISGNQTGSTFNRGDLTATNAFFWSSLDLSSYAGTDLGSTPYYIEVLDAAGKKATGYIGAVGAGETLGSELVVNSGFDTDLANWILIPAEGTIEWDAGREKFTEPGASVDMYSSQQITTTQKALYKAQTTIVSTTHRGWLNIGTVQNGETLLSIYTDIATPGTLTGYVHSPGTSIWITNKFSGPGGNICIYDNSTVKRVTDPPATAIHVVSSLNGTTRNWASIASGFDPNAIASWIIYKTNHNPVIGWYLDGVNDLVSHTSINFGKTHTLLYWIIASANKKQIVHGGAANYHVAIDGTNLYYNAGATELSQAHSGGTGKPLMIGIVRSGTTVQFFKNGIQVGTDKTIDANNNQTLTTLGSYDTPGTFLNGVILEDYGFTRAFTATEIKSYYDLTRKVCGV